MREKAKEHGKGVVFLHSQELGDQGSYFKTTWKQAACELPLKPVHSRVNSDGMPVFLTRPIERTSFRVARLYTRPYVWSAKERK